MRFSALASSATLLLTLASAQEYAQPEPDTTSMHTRTLTRTVERVVETVTSTRNSSHTTQSPPLSTASLGFIPVNNGTSTVLGTGTGPSGSAPTGPPPESGAERLGLEAVGLMAVVGLAGLVAL